MTQPSKEETRALACDVDNLRAEVSRMRAVHAEVQATQKELMPLRELAHSLRLLTQEARCVINGSALGTMRIDLDSAIRRLRVLDETRVVELERTVAELSGSVARIDDVLDNDETFMTLAEVCQRLSALEEASAAQPEKPSGTTSQGLSCHARDNGHAYEARLEFMTHGELQAEVDATLSAVLDEFEGGFGPGEIKTKLLLAELRRRRVSP